MPIYLLAADLLNTVISAIFTFSDRVLYMPYLEAPRLFGTTALSDQSCAGVIMWVPGSLVFLIPAATIAMQYLSKGHSLVRMGKPAQAPVYVHPAVASRSRFDLLTVPLIGPFLRARSGRRFMQAILLIVAIAIIVDGLFGTQVSTLNLAGVLPWTYWRAFAIIALLAAGNLFCMACPFMLFRELGRRLHLPQHSWPQALRSKWFALVLLVLFFWCYEVFSLWDKPMWTAWLIVNFFLAAFVIDALFRGASFCKYVCPIGQFQFIASVVSPLEVKVRQPDICASCKTHDCLRGNESHRGCETHLYLPRKSGNIDCTFCLDCVRACPHDNIGVIAVAPGMSIVKDPERSSVGRLSRRLDIAALALVFVFAAYANAAFMATPVVSLEENLAVRLGLDSSLPVTRVLLLIALVAAPGILAVMAARASQATKLASATVRELVCRFSVSLVPLGAGMWAAHYLFHLAVGWGSASVAVRRAADEIGWHLLNFPVGESATPLFSAHGVHVLQTLLLDAGLLLALYLMWRIALIYAPRARDASRLLLPWAAIAIVLYASGVWIVLQPMQMRGVSAAISTL
jgi:ferredoxin